MTREKQDILYDIRQLIRMIEIINYYEQQKIPLGMLIADVETLLYSLLEKDEDLKSRVINFIGDLENVNSYFFQENISQDDLNIYQKVILETLPKLKLLIKNHLTELKNLVPEYNEFEDKLFNP